MPFFKNLKNVITAVITASVPQSHVQPPPEIPQLPPNRADISTVPGERPPFDVEMRALGRIIASETNRFENFEKNIKILDGFKRVPRPEPPWVLDTQIAESLPKPINLVEDYQEITYSYLHRSNPQTLLDHVWELYDIYFYGSVKQDVYESGKEDFARELFAWIAQYTLDVIAAGVLGNIAYDVLKTIIKRMSDRSKNERKKYYSKMYKELNQLLDLLKVSENKGSPVQTQEIAKKLGISNGKTRVWLKVFGWKHMSNCTWQRVLSKTS